jgi:hypothetical protein
MSIVKRLWTQMRPILETLEGMDDPMGDYIISLRKRIEKRGSDLDGLKRHLDSLQAPAVQDDAGGR